MGWIGPVTPPGDLDLVLGVLASLFDVRGMALLPRNVIKPAPVTDQVQVITLRAHRSEALR